MPHTPRNSRDSRLLSLGLGLALAIGLGTPGCAPEVERVGSTEAGQADLDELAQLLQRTSNLDSPLGDDEKILLESLITIVLPDTGAGDFAGHEWQVQWNAAFRFFEMFLARADDHVPQARVHLRYRWEMTEEERLAWGEEDLLYRPSGSEGDEGQQAPIAYRAIPAAKHYFALIGRVELRASALVGEWESKARLKMLLRAFPLEDIARF